MEVPDYEGVLYPPKVGDVYFHAHPSGIQSWVWREGGNGAMGWSRIQPYDKHPVHKTYVLGEKDPILPSWVTKKSGNTYRSADRRFASAKVAGPSSS